MRDQLRAFWLVLTTTFGVDPARTIGSIALEGAGQLSVVLTAVWLKLVTDGLIGGHPKSIVAGVAGLAVVPALLLLSSGFGMQLRTTLIERVGFEFERRYAEISASLPTLAHHEDPEFRDKLELLRSNHRPLGFATSAVIGVLEFALQAAGTMIILASIHPLLLLLPVFVIPYLLVTSIRQRWDETAEEQSAPILRRARHLYELGYDAGAAKELRTFALARELTDRHAAAWMSAHRISMRVRWRSTALASAGFAIACAGFAGALVFIAMRALHGQASVGDVVMLIAIATRVNEIVDGAAYRFVFLGDMLRNATRFQWLMDLSSRESAGGGDGDVPDRLSRGIVLDNVTFRYPGTDRDVLSGVSLTLPAGSTIALVGENGAGKTTLVKLLCRLYEPTGGAILVDGTELATISVDRWRERLTASFQDFARFEFTAQRSAGTGDLPKLDDEHAVRDALERSGGAEIAPALAEGLATQLGRTWTDGAALSVGQWQKLAVARSFMRARPLLTVFDEPTASLDAETEHRLFERYVREAHARSGDGAVTVLVSHRFSTVRSADLIVVLDDGRIVEQGSHQGLMAENGLYAELYTIQARSYR